MEMFEEKNDTIEIEEDEFLGEDKDIDKIEDSQNYFVDKRDALDKAEIRKQTWSVREVYNKLDNKSFDLSPDYQRNLVWGTDKKNSFIESLFMGILIPPIYLVEVKGNAVLGENKYEVVDGKQRLSTLDSFLRDDIKLEKKYLEYFGDLFSNKKFSEINKEYSNYTETMLSSVLDFYVISSNTPNLIKYDIFSRLNRGASPLRVDEIRRAIYRSDTLKLLEKIVEEKRKINNGKDYGSIFSKKEIKHFKDYGRFYRSIAFYIRTNIIKEIVDDYNSRPRDMINNVLLDIQLGKILISNEEVSRIVDLTIDLKKELVQYDIQKVDFIIDSLLPLIIKKETYQIDFDGIKNDTDIFDTINQSPATTSNVNKRIKLLKNYIK